jgi:hypothetical protein
MQTQTQQAQHTPGPWHLTPGSARRDGKASITDQNWERVALVEDATETDARLIAAAPELLEALQYIVGWNPDDWSAETARDRARAAIAKAEGEV